MATSDICADLRTREVADDLVRAGRERLYPGISNPNWCILRRRREIFHRWFHGLCLQNARVLDVGGRIQPYRELIPFAHTYWSIDIRQTALVHVLANAEHLPFADNSVDIVICTQQHLPARLRAGPLALFPCYPAATVQQFFRTGNYSRVRKRSGFSTNCGGDASLLGAIRCCSFRARSLTDSFAQHLRLSWRNSVEYERRLIHRQLQCPCGEVTTDEK